MKRSKSFIIVLLLWSGYAFGHQKDSIPVPFHWNVIKINPTPAWLFSNVENITIAYERLVKPNQSFVFQIGYLTINPLFGDSVGGFFDIKRVNSNGLNASFDYRFYLLRRNQYPAPDGLYIGPYLSYYGFKFKDEVIYYAIDSVKTTGYYSSTYNLVNLGLELGYQFIFWKRLSVDLLIFGPSLSFQVSNWQSSSTMPPESEEELIHQIKEKFNEKYPLLAPFVKPNSGTLSTEFQIFFRYSISIGFHF